MTRGSGSSDIGEARVLLDRLRGGTLEEAKTKPVVSVPGAPRAMTRPLWTRALIPLTALIVGAVTAGYAAWTLKPIPPRPVTRFTVALPEGQAWSNTGRKMLALSPRNQEHRNPTPSPRS